MSNTRKRRQRWIPEALTAPLYQEIGRLKIELDSLKKKAGPVG